MTPSALPSGSVALSPSVTVMAALVPSAGSGSTVKVAPGSATAGVLSSTLLIVRSKQLPGSLSDNGSMKSLTSAVLEVDARERLLSSLNGGMSQALPGGVSAVMSKENSANWPAGMLPPLAAPTGSAALNAGIDVVLT